MINIAVITESLKFQRKLICKNCNCSIDFYDPNASCPKKKWKNATLTETGYVFDFPATEPVKITQHKTEPTDDSAPSMQSMAKSFGKAVIDESSAFLNGIPYVTKNKKMERIKICETCIFFEPKHSRCKKCGCFLKFKTMFRSQSCPIGKW